MEKITATIPSIALPEAFSFTVKSFFFLLLAGAILYLLLAATYPPIHDAVHDFRHSLAIVPCH